MADLKKKRKKKKKILSQRIKCPSTITFYVIYNGIFYNQNRQCKVLFSNTEKKKLQKCKQSVNNISIY